MTAAERQSRYRERQRAKLAQATDPSSAPDTADLRRALERAEEEIARLNAECDRLAVKVDRLQRVLSSKEYAHTRTAKSAEKVATERDALRPRIAEQDQRIEALRAERDRRRRDGIA